MTHTRVYPGTVMIESLNAHIAVIAVSATRGSIDKASLTKFYLKVVSFNWHKVVIWLLIDFFWEVFLTDGYFFVYTDSSKYPVRQNLLPRHKRIKNICIADQWNACSVKIQMIPVCNGMLGPNKQPLVYCKPLSPLWEQLSMFTLFTWKWKERSKRKGQSIAVCCL